MKKTKEQKEASKARFYLQDNRCKEQLINATNLYEYIDAVRYAYSFSIRYKSVMLSDYIDNFLPTANPRFRDMCLQSGILKDYNNGTYWFDREKAASLQEFILEHKE